MEAIISGRAGRALLLDEDSSRWFDVEDPTKITPIEQPDYHFLFGDAPDLQFLVNTDLPSASKALEYQNTCSSALDLVLISFDPELSRQTRIEALEALEELIGGERVIEQLENVLYGHPIPRTADLAGALDLCGAINVPTVRNVLQTLRSSQTDISDVYLAWKTIPSDVFRDSGQEDFNYIAIREGLFRGLVMARGNKVDLDKFRLHTQLNPAVLTIRNYREILRIWLHPFVNELNSKRKSLEFEQEESSDLAFERKRKRRRSPNLANLYKRVVSQKELISRFMQRGDIIRVRKFVDELIEYQLANGGPMFAVKSLCDLATDARNLGDYTLQLELVERGVRVKPDDGWCWTQYGDALVNVQRPAEALVAYEQAEAFGAGVVAKTGRAEVLSILGRLNEALLSYESIIAEYPNDAIAKRGHAEALKALGRLDDAVAAYDAIVTEYPQSVIAQMGRAEALRAFGRFREALAAYETIVAGFPEYVPAKVGLAETLKALGRLNESLAAYGVVIAEHPENIIANVGRAETLKVIGNYQESLAAYDAIISQYPNDVIAKIGRADLLKVIGRLEEALADYEMIVMDHPENVVAKTGRADALKALGRLDESLSAYDSIISEHPDDIVARIGRAEILKALGLLEESLDAYDAVVIEYPNSVVAKLNRAKPLMALGRLDEALAVYNAVIKEQPENIVARLGRAEALKSSGRFQEALAAYDGVIAEYSEDEIANPNLFETPRALGELNQALAAYDAVITEYPKSVVAKIGRAETLRSYGHLDDALAAYNLVIDEYPENEVARSGRAAVLRELNEPGRPPDQESADAQTDFLLLTMLSLPQIPETSSIRQFAP